MRKRELRKVSAQQVAEKRRIEQKSYEESSCLLEVGFLSILAPALRN